MIGENGFEEAGICYNAGAAVGRVLDIWKAGAPSLDLICPDIYQENRRKYQRICRRYNRDDNPLFIPESPIGGTANAMNSILAVGEGAIGICCFGAESALDFIKRPDPEEENSYRHPYPPESSYRNGRKRFCEPVVTPFFL